MCMCIQTLHGKPVWVKFCPAINIFISNFNVTFCHECSSRTELIPHTYTEGHVFSGYLTLCS